VQSRIVSELSGLQEEVDALKLMQAETSAKLAALLSHTGQSVQSRIVIVE